jgi:hypothetical protein
VTLKHKVHVDNSSALKDPPPGSFIFFPIPYYFALSYDKRMKTGGVPNLYKANQLIDKSKRLLATKPKGLPGLPPDYQASLSAKSKDMAATKAAKDALEAANKPELLAESVRSENIKPNIDIDVPDIPNPADDIEDIADVADEVAEEILEAKEPEETKEIEKIQRKKAKIHKPGIFFLGGLDWFSVDSVSGSYKGMRDMAEYVEGARHYGWNQKDEIIEEIARRDSKQPIILVGHSLGADTAVEIANKLNDLDYGYRQVDLLVTLDSVGMNNDLIPANVAKNINYFADKSWFMNDTANWARNEDKTKVENNLIHEEHTELDDNHDIQAHILAEIASLV